MEASALQKSMEKAMTICRNESEDEQRKIERKRKKVDWFEFLTDDILFEILKRLPEFFLCYKARYVCRRWLNIIRNRNLLVCASFILQKTFTARYVGVREEGQGLEIKVQDLDIPHIGMIRSWANEFLLISHDKEKKQSLYVYNLITKEGSYLPECNASCGGYCGIKCGVAISFDGLEQIYKVVHLFMGPPIECHILMLRKNIVSSKWKKIPLAPCMNDGRMGSFSPVSVQGRYFHWDDYGSRRLVSIDMVKEEIVDIRLPLPGDDWDLRYTIFEMGGYLAFCGGDDFNKPEIWILKDFQRKKWDKLQSVTLQSWYHKRFPVCGVSNKYLILECKRNRGMCYYDMKNGVEKNLDIYIDGDEGCIVHSSPPSFK